MNPVKYLLQQIINRSETFLTYLCHLIL